LASREKDDNEDRELNNEILEAIAKKLESIILDIHTVSNSFEEEYRVRCNCLWMLAREIGAMNDYECLQLPLPLEYSIVNPMRGVCDCWPCLSIC
jgi:hypothetical protein